MTEPTFGRHGARDVGAPPFLNDFRHLDIDLGEPGN
jgi:hypothetical protein